MIPPAFLEPLDWEWKLPYPVVLFEPVQSQQPDIGSGLTLAMNRKYLSVSGFMRD